MCFFVIEDLVLLCLVLPVNNTRFPFPQQLSQLPQSTESEAGGWGGESYKEIRESLTSLGRSMGCFTRKMGEGCSSLICSHTPVEAEFLLSGCHPLVDVEFSETEGAILSVVVVFFSNCKLMP